MKKFLLFLLTATLAFGQNVNVQKAGDGTNAITGNLVVGSGRSITPSGTGDIRASSVSPTFVVPWNQVNKTGSSLADLQTRSASDLSSGTLPDARFPSILPAGSVSFNLAGGTGGVGNLTWNPAQETLDLGLNSQATLQIGQEQLIRVQNSTGTTLTDGQLVYISGSQGQRPVVSLAQANTPATSSQTIGMVTQTIADGAAGFVTVSGIVNNVNTNGYADGTQLWLSPTTPGGYTSTQPSAPNHSVAIGYVVKGGSAGGGSIFVNVKNGEAMADLHDVVITAPVLAGSTLLYDAATPAWRNARISAGTGLSATYGNATMTLANTGVTSISGTAGQVNASGSTGNVTLSLPSTITQATTFNSSSGLTVGATGSVGILTVSDTRTIANSGQALLSLNIGDQSWSWRNANGSLLARDDTAGSYLFGIARSSGNVSVLSTTASTSTTSGALTVSGGVGVAGGLNAGGTIATSVAGDGFTGYDYTGNATGATAYNHIAAFKSRPTYSGSNTMAELRGFQSSPTHSGAGTVTSGKQIILTSTGGAGPLTNDFGIYSDMGNTRATSNFFIYHAGLAPSLFSGQIRTSITENANGATNSSGHISMQGYGASQKQFQLGYNTTGNYGWMQAGNYGTAWSPILMNANGGNVLIGTATDSSNGRLQLAAHTTSAGGIGFGTDTSLYRISSAQLATNAGALTGGVGVGYFSLIASGTAPMTFNNGDGEAFRVTSGRGVNIGGTGAVSAGNLNVAGTTASTSSTTGALTVAGGLGVGGAIYTGGTVQIPAGSLFATPNFAFYQSGVTGYIRDITNAGMALAFVPGTASTRYVIVDPTTASTSTSTGALVVNGGVGVAGRVTAGGNVWVTPSDAASNVTVQRTTTAYEAVTRYRGTSSTNDWGVGLRASDTNFTIRDEANGQTAISIAPSTNVATFSSTVSTTGGAVEVSRTGANDAFMRISADAGRSRNLSFNTAGARRWIVAASSTAESGSNAGSDFTITRYSDADAGLGTALTITRNAGNFLIGTTTQDGNTARLNVVTPAVNGNAYALHLRNPDTNNTHAVSIGMSAESTLGGSALSEIQALRTSVANGHHDFIFSSWNGSALEERFRVRGGATGAGGATVTSTTASTSSSSGALVVTGGAGIGGNVTVGSGSAFAFSSASRITNDADGLIRLSNAANNNFSRLLFGGNTSSFPALRRNLTALEVVLADATAWAPLNAGAIKSNDTTASTSTTTGALVVSGGVGVNGAVFSTSSEVTNSQNSTTSYTVRNANTGTLAAASLIATNSAYSGGFTLGGTGASNVGPFRGNRGMLFGPFDLNYLSGAHVWWVGSTGAGNDPSTSTEIFRLSTTTSGAKITHTPQNSSQGGTATVGVGAEWKGATLTNNTAAASSTVASQVWHSWGNPAFAASNANVTITDAATLYVQAPTAGTNVTLTNSWGLWNTGNTRLDGALRVGGGMSISGGATPAGTAGALAYGNNVLYAGGSSGVNIASGANGGLVFIHGGAANNGGGVQLYGSTSGTPNEGRLTVANSSSVTWNSTAVTVPLSTASTSTTTGALVVSGGVGVAGAINGGTTIKVGGPLTNRGADFRADSATAGGLFVQNRTSDVGAFADLSVGTSSTTASLQQYSAAYTTSRSKIANSGRLFANNSLSVHGQTGIGFWTGNEGAETEIARITSAGVQINPTNGTGVDLIASATATLDFPSISAGGQQDLTITVTGASTGDVVQLGLPAAPTAGVVFNAFVSAANTVTVRASNITGSPIDPASATYRAAVTSF